jgi:hypothetical protein
MPSSLVRLAKKFQHLLAQTEELNMSHDHSLGGPVNVGIQPGANHRGPCNDGVFGCTRCFNGANDGEGTVGKCDWCKKENEFLRITMASDEPVSYAVCKKCRIAQQEALKAELEEFENSSYDYDDE